MSQEVARGTLHRPCCCTNPQEQKEHLIAHALVEQGLAVNDEGRLVRGEIRIFGTRELHAQIDRDPASPREHRHATMLQLRLAHPLNVLWGRQTHGIEANIANHARQVSRLLHEGERLALGHHLRRDSTPARRGQRRSVGKRRRAHHQHANQKPEDEIL
eukprot:scaffold82273_cov32-Phaeocystis_antarctica.AAC.2